MTDLDEKYFYGIPNYYLNKILAVLEKYSSDNNQIIQRSYNVSKHDALDQIYTCIKESNYDPKYLTLNIDTTSSNLICYEIIYRFISSYEDEISKEIYNIIEEYEKDKESFWRLFEVFNNQFVNEYSNLPMRERILDKHKEENKTRETILTYIGQFIDRNKSIETILHKKFIDN